MRLDGRVVAVTGGGRGIGRAICLAFAKEGARVVVNDVDIEPANEVAKEIEKLGQKAVVVQADVRYRDQAQRIVDAAIDNFGKIDIMVNNAGTTRDLALHRMTEKDWDDVVDIALKGSFNCTQAVAGQMVEQAKKELQGGEAAARKIINLTSGSGVRGNPGQANYSSAKAGVIGLTKATAKELARYNILVNAICPFAATRITDGMSDELKEAFTKRVPLGRWGDPEKDIAPVVVFLASDDANYITGQVIIVSGGLDM